MYIDILINDISKLVELIICCELYTLVLIYIKKFLSCFVFLVKL